MCQSILIVGNSGGTNVAESFTSSARKLGLNVIFFDVKRAFSKSSLINKLAWRLWDKKPINIHRFSRDLLERESVSHPKILLTTGLSPVTENVINTLRKRGLICVHYSTDDPWNPGQRAGWHHDALKVYDIVFTPRKNNQSDFIKLGCKNVQYLPFGYDEDIFSKIRVKSGFLEKAPDVMFVGGADKERVNFFKEYLTYNVPISLVGAYWERFKTTSHLTLGHVSPKQLAELTLGTKVNICLVRRSNRDGHVMRSFEIAALGGCMVVEDTEEHREIFGQDGECVLYFRNPSEAADAVKILLKNDVQRARMGDAVIERIVAGGNTYTDRLRSILDDAENLMTDSMKGI